MERTLVTKEPGVGAVDTSCGGRLFHSGMVLGKKVFSLRCGVGWNVMGEVVSMPGGSPGMVSL